MRQWLPMAVAASALSLLAPWASLGQAAPAPRAAPSSASESLPARLAELGQLFVSLGQAEASRTELLKRLDRYRKSIRDTQRQSPGPSRDFKLRRLLSDSQALAKEISALDQKIARERAALHRTRQALAKLLESLKEEDRARVRRELERTRRSEGSRSRPRQVLKVAKPTIHPLDGPREIEEKADALRDSEDKIRKQIKEIEDILSALERRRRLRAISSGLDRYTGIFNEDSSSRRVVRIRPTRTSADSATGSPTPDPSREGDLNPPESFAGVVDDPQVGEGTRTAVSGTYAVVLRELLTAETINALRQAGRSGDPEERRRALERARAELRRTATELQRKSQTFRQRARQLRSQESR